jgi:hypothetical protein
MWLRQIWRNVFHKDKKFEKLEEKFRDDLLYRSRKGVKKLYIFAAISPSFFIFDFRGFYFDLKKQLDFRLENLREEHSELEKDRNRLAVLYWYLR